jgi:hypothetical protein
VQAESLQWEGCATNQTSRKKSKQLSYLFRTSTEASAGSSGKSAAHLCGKQRTTSGTLFAETIFLLMEQARVEAVFAIPGLDFPKRITWASSRSKVEFSGYTAAPWVFLTR